MFAEYRERLVYVECFKEGEEARRRFDLNYIEKENPYKQGTTSWMGWEEGFEYA